MGKYLQDIMFGIYKEGEVSDLYKELRKSCRLIESLVNHCLPQKIELGNNIWRLIIRLTFEKELNGKAEVIGQCQDYYIFCDRKTLEESDVFERKKILLEVLFEGIIKCCNIYSYPVYAFSEIKQTILNEGIVFDKTFKEKKTSPDRKHAAQIKVFLSEEYDNRKVEVIIFDSSNLIVKTILVGNFDFRAFDRLQWTSNHTLHLYHINAIKSYKRKKVADDYYYIDITDEQVKYMPVTRESIFEYGVKLLTETDEYTEALRLINEAKTLGHGKADNILRNLEVNPSQRNKAILLQTPKKT